MNNALAGLRQLLDSIVAWWANIALLISNLATIDFVDIYTLLARWVFPVLAVTIFLRCVLPLLRNQKYESVWGYLEVPGSLRIPLTHWENSLGRSKLSDIVVNLPFVSRSHAVLTYGKDTWKITD
ncbi:MAG: FHA domain-containing protein, partial [Bacillota bacterium]